VITREVLAAVDRGAAGAAGAGDLDRVGLLVVAGVSIELLGLHAGMKGSVERFPLGIPPFR